MLVGDDRPDEVLAALDGPGPVVVLDHRRPTLAATAQDALPQAPPGTWLVALTSGSTARPRGVCRTRASWQASVDALAELTGTATGSRVLVPGPLSSTLFLHAAWHARQVGARPLLAPLHTDEPWDVVHLVPHLLDRMLDSGADVAGRTAVVAGAAVPSRLVDRARAAGLRLVVYYGAAELSFVAAGASPVALTPFPGVEVQVRDGVLWVRGPYLALGYLLGAEVPDGPWQRDDAGWATVGDRGSLADGYVRVHGRGSAAVQTGGATVHVADVEAVLRTAPGVVDVVVTGTPHPRLGAVVTAVVEARDPALSRRTLRDWSASRLSPAQRPRRWVVVRALPRTPSGKVDRAALQQRLEPPSAGRVHR